MKNGSFFKTCLKCRVHDREIRLKKCTVDKNGLQGCRVCSKRIPLVDFPSNLNTPGKKLSWCLSCINKSKKANDARYAPFQSRVDKYRKRYLNCAHCGEILEEGDDHWDHIPERGDKIRKVTDYVYWSSSLAGKTLNERSRVHQAELEKCERVCVVCHLKRTKERLGEPSKNPKARYARQYQKGVKQENWEFIKNKQGGFCGCGDCEVKLIEGMAIEFDHMWGEKLFNMAHAGQHPKEDRVLEREKGRFVLSRHHRRITKKRRLEAYEERNKKIKLF